MASRMMGGYYGEIVRNLRKLEGNWGRIRGLGEFREIKKKKKM